MTIVFIIGGIALVAMIALLALGKLNDTGADNDPPDSALVSLSDDPAEVSARDIDSLKFSLALRGYRIDQVDHVLDQLSATVALQSAEIERLKAGQMEPSQNQG